MVDSIPLPRLTSLAQQHVGETLLGTGWFTAPGALPQEVLRRLSFRNVRITETRQGWPDPLIIGVTSATLYVLPVLEIPHRSRAVSFEEWYIAWATDRGSPFARPHDCSYEKQIDLPGHHSPDWRPGVGGRNQAPRDESGSDQGSAELDGHSLC